MDLHGTGLWSDRRGGNNASSACASAAILVGCDDALLHPDGGAEQRYGTSRLAKNVLLEVSVENVGGAQAAESAGAQRLELCSLLSAGGVTPDATLIPAVRAAVKIPIFMMIRPRAGGFVYSDAEFAAMRESIALAKASGMDGIVVGMLTAEHTIDVTRTTELVRLSEPLPVTFHRAFDVSANLQQSLAEVLQTGAQRILSSGGAFDAFAGAATLATLRKSARNRIIIVPGTGINPGNIAQVARISGAREIHSGLGSVLPYGTEDFSAFETEVRKMVTALDGSKK
jgi:copper homeostasis protein